MALKRANIFVSGDVQMVGFRGFVKNIADSLGIKGYAENLPDGRVQIVCEGEENGIGELIDSIKNKASSLSKVGDLQTEYGDYAGEFVDFERRGGDVPKKATLDDLLKVMFSFDNKAEKMVCVLNKIHDHASYIPAIKGNTEKILEYTSHIPAIKDNTEKILEYTSHLPAIKDNTEGILEYSSHLPAIKDNTEGIHEHTSHLLAMQEDIAGMNGEISGIKQNTCLNPAMKEDTHAIRTDTKEIATNLREKYEEMNREISQMKVTLSRIEAKVFG